MSLRIRTNHEPINANYSGLYLNPDFGFRITGSLAHQRLADEADRRITLKCDDTHTIVDHYIHPEGAG